MLLFQLATLSPETLGQETTLSYYSETEIALLFSEFRKRATSSRCNKAKPHMIENVCVSVFAVVVSNEVQLLRYCT